MKSPGYSLAVVVLLAASACGGSGPTGVSQPPCTAETGTVTPTVSAGRVPVFDWEPACAVALLLIEEDASDYWGISSDEESWTSPEQANRITPPVTYGVVPPGVSQIPDDPFDVPYPIPLEVGVTYELVLWRILPEGSGAVCIERFENVCLLAVHEFTP